MAYIGKKPSDVFPTSAELDTITSTNLNIDASGDITLDADGGNISIKDGGTTVGNIGNDSTDLYIAGTTHGIKFDAIDASTMYIRPVNNSGTNLTGQIDLGQAGNVFRDAYVSGGVYFAPNSYPANYLDDYEEGTWTPVWSSSGSATYGIQVGTYTKVGNIVHASCYLFMTNKSTLSGALQLAGLPFTSENLSNNYQSGSIWINNTVNGNVFDGDFNLQGYIAPNSALFNVQSLDGDGTVAAISSSDVNNTTDLMINISYRTA